MIGLEYILGLYNMPHIELAEKLSIKKQNINMWVKKKQKIPEKYLPILEELFGLDKKYFTKDLSEIEKLEIQKEKLKKDLKPIIKKHEQQFMIGKGNDMVQVPVYDKEEINAIERDIEKAKLMARFKKAMDVIDNNPYIDTYKLIVELMENVQHEVLVHKTIKALGHYFDILPDWVSTGSEQDQFEDEIFEVFDNNNF
ncbi:helix-turn-helix domain-containing protein [Clostridium botulinum]|uniref:transcriptional regulator n=1 Tax=Clostridium botulinum TaxID=1491 RepID=UPI0007E1266B|nr:transcriptional regulator [Clostridium botulinum]KEJ01822.1 hypothetical protein N497_03475 [Clostridium botulinum F 357]MBE1303386.1 helix-turn-helix domain-containing protein [Clostridium botulinum]